MRNFSSDDNSVIFIFMKTFHILMFCCRSVPCGLSDRES